MTIFGLMFKQPCICQKGESLSSKYFSFSFIFVYSQKKKSLNCSDYFLVPCVYIRDTSSSNSFTLFLFFVYCQRTIHWKSPKIVSRTQFLLSFAAFTHEYISSFYLKEREKYARNDHGELPCEIFPNYFYSFQLNLIENCWSSWDVDIF